MHTGAVWQFCRVNTPEGVTVDYLKRGLSSVWTPAHLRVLFMLIILE